MTEDYDDLYEEEAAEDDLTGVSEQAELPEEGWYRAKILGISTKPAKSGAAMRTVTFRLNGTDHETKEYFAIGAKGQGGDIAKRRYRILARCCGVTENDEGEFKFTTSELEGAEVYARGEHQQDDPKYDPKWTIRELRPLTEEPDELVAVSGDDDDVPF